VGTIDVSADGTGGRFTVRIREGDGSPSKHEIGVPDADWERFGGGYETRVELVQESVRFLLEREPKESILRSFDLRDIARYFPDYGETFSRRGP
jgi:hypothetical protein